MEISFNSLITTLFHSSFLTKIYFTAKIFNGHMISVTELYPSRHGCISDASLRRLIQRLRDISKRADLQISEMSTVRCIKDASSETSLRSLRSSQRRLWVSSEPVIHCFQTEAFFFGYLLIYLRVFKYFAKLILKVAQSLV